MEGSILAPWAHVPNPQGVILGQIAARSWNGMMQLNHQPFQSFGQPNLNGPPAFTSTPVTEATATLAYAYQASAGDPDGDPLAFALITGPLGLSLDAATGLVTWTPTTDQVGGHPVELRVSDPAGLSDSQSFTITVDPPPNQAPFFTSTPVNPHLLIPAAGEGQPVDLSTWTVIDIPSGDQVASNWTFNGDFSAAIQRNNARPSILLGDFELRDDQVEGMLRVNTIGDDDYIGFVFGYRDAANFYLFDWKQRSQTVALRGMNVKRLRAEPDLFLEPGYLATYPESGQPINLYHNDIPWQDHTDYRFTLDFHPGEFIITVHRDDTLLDAITLQDDSHGSGRFGFYNHSQERVRYAGFTREILAQREYVYAVSALDADGDPLSFQLLQGPEGMTFEAATREIHWLTTSADVGQHPVRLRVEDGRGGFAEQAFLLTVAIEVPVITSQPVATAKVGRAYAYDVAAVDPTPGDVLSYSLVQAPAGMNIAETSGLITWTPVEPDLGAHPIAVEVMDLAGNSASQDYTLTVYPAGNNPPIFLSQALTRAYPNEVYSYPALAVDPDGDDIDYQLELGPPGMTANAATGHVQWQPTMAAVGIHPVEIAARDSQGAETIQPYLLEVGANGPPNITSIPPLSASEGLSYEYQVQAEEPDGDPLIFTLDQAPSSMTIETFGGQIQWTPAADQAGLHAVSLTVRDPRGATDGQSYQIQVSEAVNGRPRITSIPPETAQAGLPYVYAVSAADPENDPVTFSLSQAPAGMVIDGGSGLVSWTPGLNQVGSFPVIIRATDDQGNPSSQSYDLSVTAAPNRAPEILSEAMVRAIANQPYAYTVSATDADGDLLSFAMATAPAGMSIDPAGGLIQWLPIGPGNERVSLSVSDGRGGIATQSFIVVVLARGNTVPVFTSQPGLTVQAGIEYRYDAEVFDPDGYPISFSLGSAPAAMTLDRTRGILAWTPTLADLGPHNIALTVTDAHGASANQSYIVTVTDPGDITPPRVFANLDKASADPDEPVTVGMAATDNVAVTAVALDINGIAITLDASNQAVFTSGQPGVYVVTAQAWDAAGNTAKYSQTFHIRDPLDSEPPFIQILTPERDTTLSAPVPITGTVQDTNLAEWILEIGRVGQECFSEIARGTQNLTVAELTTLDTSLLANGMYRLRLTAFDVNGRGLQDSATYLIDGNFKVGRFTLGFRDLEIPLKGLPARVNRLYDSSDKCPGDFGIGWNLADIDLQVSVTLGRLWDLVEDRFCITGGGDAIYPPYTSCSGTEFPLYRVDPLVKHYLSVTLPGGETEKFDLRLIDPNPSSDGRPPGSFPLVVPDGLEAEFPPSQGTTSTIHALNAGTLLFRLVQTEDGGSEYQALDSDFEPWNPQRFELTTAAGIVYLIHARDGLQSITDREGNQLTLSKTGITHSSGTAIVFSRDPQDRITAVTDPEGNQIQYGYDAAGDLVSVTDQAGQVTRFSYNNNHNLVDIIDPGGNIPARMYYDGDGRLIAQEDAYGNRIEYDHDIAGRQEIVRDRQGHLTVFVYDQRGNVLRQTDPLGNTTAYGYDSDDNETSQTIALGTPLEATTSRTFDGLGNLLSETNPLGHAISYQYDGQQNPTRIEDADGDATSFTYDTLGRPTNITDPEGGVISSSYQLDGVTGHLTTTTSDALGQVAVTQENRNGWVVREVDARGVETTYSHDARGNVRTETRTRMDANGNPVPQTWQRFYDAQSRLIREQNPLGQTRLTEYDADGNVAATVDANGNRTEMVYDARGNLVKTIYPDGTSETSSYDGEGNQLTATDRSGRITRFEYDALDRLVKTSFPDGSQTRQIYDAAGRVNQVIDQRGNATTYQFDLAGNRTQIIDALGGESQFGYDADGNLITFTDALGQITRYEYDAKNRRTRTVFHDGTSTSSAYDALDRRTAETDQTGIITGFEYGPNGNLAKVTDALGVETSYGYDEEGNQTSQLDALGRETN